MTLPSYRPPRRRASAALSLAALALAAMLSGAPTSAADERKPASTATNGAKPALTVTLVQPQSATLASNIQANGSIAAWQEAIVGAEAVGLRLAEVRVNVGDFVQRGQVLAVYRGGKRPLGWRGQVRQHGVHQRLGTDVRQA